MGTMEEERKLETLSFLRSLCQTQRIIFAKWELRKREEKKSERRQKQNDCDEKWLKERWEEKI